MSLSLLLFFYICGSGLWMLSLSLSVSVKTTFFPPFPITLAVNSVKEQECLFFWQEVSLSGTHQTPLAKQLCNRCVLLLFMIHQKIVGVEIKSRWFPYREADCFQYSDGIDAHIPNDQRKIQGESYISISLESRFSCSVDPVAKYSENHDAYYRNWPKLED